MSVCIKSLIKNMNIVIGCSIGCSLPTKPKRKESPYL